MHMRGGLSRCGATHAIPLRFETMNDPEPLTGGCACGAVRFVIVTPAKRAGLCHCPTCRKAHAAAFNPFVVFDREAVAVSGEPKIWESSPGYQRAFCPDCGSRMIGYNATEAEISLGSFDQPGRVTPEYGSWIVWREPWLPALNVPQFSADRPG